jgi:hypothetical protein
MNNGINKSGDNVQNQQVFLSMATFNQNKMMERSAPPVHDATQA